MLSRAEMHGYQDRAVDFLLEHPRAALWLEMGLGKTIVVLTALDQMMDSLQAKAALVVAPLRVAQHVWEREAQRWEHTRWLRFSLLHGDRAQREHNLAKHADVYVINYEGLPWLAQRLEQQYLSKGRVLPFDVIVFDEVTKLKNSTSLRHKSLRKFVGHIPRRIGLTGTPAANGYLDLHGQFLALDDGQRLGQYVTHFRETFFYREGYGAWGRWIMHRWAAKQIQDAIQDITLTMKASEYLSLPETIVNDIWVDLPERTREYYQQLEEEMFVEMDTSTVEVFNAAALTTKCLQMANGAVYNAVDSWTEVHEAKLDALEDIVEEAAGSPVLVVVSFHHDAHRILKKFRGAEWLRPGLGAKDASSLIDRWNAGQVPLLIGHPASMGHGLNLQDGGHIQAWFGLTWSLDLYEQTIARLMRQGQERPVIVHRILARDTTDEAVRAAIRAKIQTQEGLKTALVEYRKKRLATFAA